MSKNQELQKVVTDEEAFKEEIAKDGLIIVDVYSGWCGPCKAMVSSFKKFNLDFGDRGLKFICAEADKIPMLEKYAGRSMPTFHFYHQNGELLESVEGVDYPKINKIVMDFVK
eukprot:GFYU01001701.1.p1 GENE.GFYU01001701.1~~GFYU01001701.1.p1  ORF type:complete len:126 (-),score=36.44 GFYU01001701.1:278-616(-)